MNDTPNKAGLKMELSFSPSDISPSQIQVAIEQNKQALTSQNTIINDQQDTINKLQTKVTDLGKRVEEQEQYSRRTSLRFNKIKTPTNGNGRIIKPINTDFLVLQICNEQLGLDINLKDLGRTHPIGKVNNRDVESNPGPADTVDISDQSISIFHCNIRSLRNKLDYISNVIEEFDIIFFSETHLAPFISNEKIALPEYETPIRKDRNSDGGGVIMYYKSNIKIKRRLDLEHDSLEIMWF
ncbi:unnamed protein product [Mytilus coruscus]|uniref:Endonuclease/exonuclease/phosphatase domain-containing protein n=1 Tax=Mytilus coruscus TaxID=42192 RepID=A0A6J8C931_MYTCO|nr:unnamed protein product [Mytilus coruscus]